MVIRSEWLVQENTKAHNNLTALHTYAFNVEHGPEDGLTATKRDDQALGCIELHPINMHQVQILSRGRYRILVFYGIKLIEQLDVLRKQ